LGKEFASLNAHGTASSSSLFAVYPFFRSLASSLSGTLTLERKKLVDTYLDTTYAVYGIPDIVNTTDKQVQMVNMGLNGKHQDAFAGGGVTSFDLSLVQGRLSMDEQSLSFDLPINNGPGTNGAFSRMSYNINRQQRLNDDDSLSATLSGQLANKNLNSSEKFSLGGSNGVRAYPQGEASGDLGWMTNLELRHNFDPTLQGVLFYDAGSVQINKSKYSATDNTRRIAGSGVGVNAKFYGVQINAFMAWRASSSIPVSEPRTLKRNPRLGLQLSVNF
jgi:hemolysin activation/secretion protein